MQKALWEALHRRRSGLSAEACLAILRGINSYLDELMLTLGCINWQTGPALTLITDQLHQRAARRWDRASWLMLLKNRIWPILHFVKIVIVGSIISLSVQGIAMHFIAWPSRITILLLGLALIATGLLLHFVLTSEWPRRVLVLVLLLLTMTPAMNTFHIQSPWWIQIHTITDISKNLSDSGPWNSSYPSQGQSKIIFQHSNDSVSVGPSNQHPFALPVPPPSPTPTKIIPSPISTRSISSEIEPEEICCHRVYQPK